MQFTTSRHFSSTRWCFCDSQSAICSSSHNIILRILLFITKLIYWIEFTPFGYVSKCIAQSHSSHIFSSLINLEYTNNSASLFGELNLSDWKSLNVFSDLINSPLPRTIRQRNFSGISTAGLWSTVANISFNAKLNLYFKFEVHRV